MGDAKYLFINVYLPYCSQENWPDYLLYLGKLASIVDSSEADGIALIGDFNSDPYKAAHRYFFRELEQFCNGRDLNIADTRRLAEGSYTHVNNGNLSRSWLDHCIVTPMLNDAWINVLIDNNYSGSDHFPLYLQLNIQCSYKKQEVETINMLDID